MDQQEVPMPPMPPSQPAMGNQPQPTAQMPEMICPQCHFPVKPEYYYCPNCGKSLHEAPLSTSLGTQLWIYGFSIILPIICFLAVSYWPGIKYFKSKDPGAQQIGLIAIILMALSTIITFWLAIVWIQQAVQSSVNSVGNLGGLGGF
jgi:hypothetical protein